MFMQKIKVKISQNNLFAIKPLLYLRLKYRRLLTIFFL